MEGFDNIAAALSVSPAFLDQYVTAARQVARLAVGNPESSRFQREVLHGGQPEPRRPLPPGTRGGIRFKHNFRQTASIASPSTILRSGRTPLLENESTLVILIDDKIVFRKPIGGPADQALADRKGGDGRAQVMERFAKIPVKVEAGVRDVVVAFIDRSHVETDENLEKLRVTAA